MPEPYDKTQTGIPPAASADKDARTPFLIILSGKATVGKMFALDRPVHMLGRSSDCDIYIDDEGVSRHHARLERMPEGFRLVDLGSRNGTFCNGQRIQLWQLRDGDKLQVGSTTILKFSYQDALDEQLQK